MVAVPSITPAVAGDKISATGWAAQDQNAVGWLMDPPAVHVFASAGPSFANSTTTLCAWTDEQYDWATTAMHDNVTNNSRIVLPASGRYRVSVFVQFGSGGSYPVDVYLRKNSAGSVSGGTSIRTENFVTVPIKWPLEYRFTANDYLEVFVNQQSGSAKSASTASLGYGLQVTWVGI